MLRRVAAAGGDYRRGVRGLQAMATPGVVWDAKGLLMPPIKKATQKGRFF
jgi:hypothetical protein